MQANYEAIYHPLSSPIRELSWDEYLTQRSRKPHLRLKEIAYQDILTGNKKVWDSVERTSEGGVVVVGAITRERTLIVLDQFRIPIGDWLIENPAWLIDPGDSIETAAIRELREETGYQIGEIVSIGQTYSSAGMTNEAPHILLATGCTPHPDGCARESTEWMRQFELPLDKAENILREAEKRGRKVDYKFWRILSEAHRI